MSRFANFSNEELVYLGGLFLCSSTEYESPEASAHEGETMDCYLLDELKSELAIRLRQDGVYVVDLAQQAGIEFTGHVRFFESPARAKDRFDF